MMLEIAAMAKAMASRFFEKRTPFAFGLSPGNLGASGSGAGVVKGWSAFIVLPSLQTA